MEVESFENYFLRNLDSLYVKKGSEFRINLQD